MLGERDIEELAAKITGGAQEAFVAGLTAALVDDLMAGVVNATTRSTLGALAAANREHVDTLLMEHRAKISETVMAEVRRTLLAADERDAEAIAAFRHASPEGATRRARMMAEQAAVGIRQMVERQNVALARQAEVAWYAVAAEGIRYTEAGAMPKGWIDKAVVRLADAGVKTVDYRSGTSSQVDVAIKRHMRTQVNQAAGRMEIDRLDACGHRFVQTTAHFGAREEHQEWQGKAFCLDGACEVGGVRYPDFYAATGYGTVTGLCGANCRHHFGVHVPGLSKLPGLPEKVNGMDAREYYEATQRQRELERRVRKTKREISAMEQAGLGLESPAYVQKRLVLGRQQAALRSHCADKGLVRQYARERAYGVDSQPRALRSTAWSPKNSPSLNSAVPRSLKRRVDGFLKSPPTAPGKDCARIFRDNRSIIRIADAKATRSYFTPATGKLTLKKGCDARTVFHESGHLFDYALRAGPIGNGTWTSARFKAGGTTFGDELLRDYGELLASRGLGAGKDRELAAAIRAELAGAPPRATVELSDILSGCSSGAAHLGFGHSRAYWARSPDNLPIEAFANMFSAASTSAEAYAALSRYFPRGAKMFETMIGAIR